MEMRTRDLLFGTGNASLGEGMRLRREPVRLGELLSTVRGREHVERAIGRPLPGAQATSGADELLLMGPTVAPMRGLVSGGGAGGVAGVAQAQVEYANPVYNGLYAQSLMRDHGFVPPLAAAPAHQEAAPTAVGAALDDVADTSVRAAVADAVEDVAAQAADAEQRMLGALQRLGELPAERQVGALAAAVDATAEHGGDTFEVLARTLTERPLEAAASALDAAIDDAARVVAPVVEAVAPVSKPVAAAPTTILRSGGDDALRGVMSFAAGVDDTLRLLAQVR